MSVSSGLDLGTRKAIFTGVNIGGASGITALNHNLNTTAFTYEVRNEANDSKVMLPLDIVNSNTVNIESTLAVAITVTVTIIG
jgi:hypothetical protein